MIVKAKDLKRGMVIYIPIKQVIRIVDRVSLAYPNVVYVWVTESVLSHDGINTFDVLSYWGHGNCNPIPVIGQSTEVV